MQCNARERSMHKCGCPPVPLLSPVPWWFTACRRLGGSDTLILIGREVLKSAGQCVCVNSEAGFKRESRAGQEGSQCVAQCRSLHAACNACLRQAVQWLEVPASGRTTELLPPHSIHSPAEFSRCSTSLLTL